MKFFTSDTHFDHANICKATSQWPDSGKCRDFKSLEEMNDALVENINLLVGEDDTLYHLGDWSFNGVDNILRFRKRIRCKNIFLVYGNHDHHIERNKIQNGGWFPKSLFSQTDHLLETRIKGVPTMMTHYSNRVWKGSHKGFFHIYGHSHASLEEESWGKSMDVGVDNAFRLVGQYRPFTEAEVWEILNARDIKFVDHHDERTSV